MIASAIAVSSYVAGGHAAHSPKSPGVPADPPNRRGTSAGADGGGPRDARTIAVELMALTAFDRAIDGGDRPRSPASTAAFPRDWQWNEGRNCAPAHPYYGGTGRWAKSAPDLVHTALLLRASRGAGVAASDRYIQRATIFIARCQVVDGPDAQGGRDRHDLGGFAEGPVVDPMPGIARVRLGRPCGASTCLGVTSLLAAGVAPDDARVQAAFHWLEEHYSLDVHPGAARPREGLYGYYFEFANAMTALKHDRIRDARGVLHDWRSELGRKLAEQQHADGSWTNPDESPEPANCSGSTVTSFALLTLQQLHP
jgi:hypothetical protein